MALSLSRAVGCKTNCSTEKSGEERRGGGELGLGREAERREGLGERRFGLQREREGLGERQEIGTVLKNPRDVRERERCVGERA